MISLHKSKALVIRESKIVHKSHILHPLARFVTEEAVCLMFGIDFQDIYSVQCWRHIVYVHAKGISRFISYADFPPIILVKPPTPSEMVKWRRRWKEQNQEADRDIAPRWWAIFFAHEFSQAPSKPQLYSWGKLVQLIKFGFREDNLEDMRESYRYKLGIINSVSFQPNY